MPATPRPDTADFLGGLLHALAESLDVREIFARISEAAARAVPHDFLMLGVWSEDRQRVRLMALSGDLPGIPGDVPVPESMREPRRRRSRRRAPAPADSTPDAIGDFLNSRSGRAIEREIVRGVFGLLRKRR